MDECKYRAVNIVILRHNIQVPEDINEVTQKLWHSINVVVKLNFGMNSDN